ncbi:MAG: tetratricopeptide repeat protein [Planctomycetaceae bacterium]|nr:tetratricopeptide repeat protein [Planctomycetaceae bacterium]
MNMTHVRTLILLVCLMLPLPALLFAEGETGSENDVIRQYRTILTQLPKRGAAFDKVYNHYLDIGQSEVFYRDCQTAAEKHPDDAAAHLLFALVAERRKNTDAAVKSYQTAAGLDPQNPLPPLYLAELLIHQRKYHEAAALLEKKLSEIKEFRNKNDQRAMLQTLASAYHRFGHSEKAINTWNKLTGLFPNDPDIPVQLAEMLEFDGKLDESLKQYQRLIKMTEDDFDRIRFSLAAADIKIRLNRDEEALADLDALLGLLDTENYLADTVRDRIDRIFDRSRNTNRQIGFYRKRIETEPHDTGSVFRLVKTLQKTGRDNEAETLLTESVKKNPSHIPLRLALIDVFIARKNYAAAISQFQAVNEIEPDKIEYLAQWGSTVRQNPDLPETERKAEAVKIWNRIIESAPDDPAVIVQAAEIFFRNNLFDEAENCYKKALELRPDDFAYREYLSMFYHQRKNRQKVLETLLPPEDQTLNVRSREETGNLLLTLGYAAEAQKILKESADAAPDDSALQLRYIESLLRTDNISAAAEVFDKTEKRIADDEQFSVFLQQTVNLLTALQKTGDAVKIYETKKEKNYRTLWTLAAFYQQAASSQSGQDRKVPSAAAVSEKALKLKQTPPLLRFAAGLYVQTGNSKEAVKLYQKLVQEDSVRAGEYRQQLVNLYIQRGEVQAAVETSKQLLGRGTENAGRLRYVADLLLSVNKRDEAVKLLQQALTYEPGNADVLRVLAQTLSQANRREESIELFWRLYDILDNTTAKLSVIETLSQEYHQLGKESELTDLLKQKSMNYEHRWESLQALVKVHRNDNEPAEAQAVLETMLELPAGNKEDADKQMLWVLRELVSVTESMENSAAAVRYQEAVCQKINDLAEQDHLFHLYEKTGNMTLAKKLFLDQVLRQNDTAKRYEMIDKMIVRQEWEAVTQVLDFLEVHETENWNLLLRKIIIESCQNKPVEHLVKEFRSLNIAEPKPAGAAAVENFWTAHIDAVFRMIFSKTTHFKGGSRHSVYDMSYAVPNYQKARFIVLFFLLREAAHKDFTVSKADTEIRHNFRNKIEEIRAMFPADSENEDVLVERICFERGLMSLCNSDRQEHFFPDGMLKRQIDQNVCQKTLWQITRKIALNSENTDWDEPLFQILVTESICELVARRFLHTADSDARLSAELSQIFDNYCHQQKLPPINADQRGKMINTAVYLVKQSVSDHKESQNPHVCTPLTLAQKTDKLMLLWKRQSGQMSYHWTSRYSVLQWILRSQHRSADLQTLDALMVSQINQDPNRFAERFGSLPQPVNEDLILFMELSGYESMEDRFHRFRKFFAAVQTDAMDMQEKNAFGHCLFPCFFNHDCITAPSSRYDIFTEPEINLLHRTSDHIVHYLVSPQQDEYPKFVRAFLGVDPPYAVHQLTFQGDQIIRLNELERSLFQFLDFSFQIISEFNLEPQEFEPQTNAPVTQGLSGSSRLRGQASMLASYRNELQGDRPIDRNTIYNLIPAPARNDSDVERFFFRALFICRALDTKTRFVVAKNEEDKIIPLRKNCIGRLRLFLETKKHSTAAVERAWANHLTETFGDLLKPVEQPSAKQVKPSPDIELLQLAEKLEKKGKTAALESSEKLALALLNIKLQKYTAAVAVLDSIELNTASDVSAREWIAAHLAVKFAKTETAEPALWKRGTEAVNRLLNDRLPDKDLLALLPVLKHFNRSKDEQRILEQLIVTISDQRLLTELLYKLRAEGERQKENAARTSLRILQNPAFLQNTRRLTADVYLLENAVKSLRETDQTEKIVPVLEMRLKGLRDKTDSRILLAKLYLSLDRLDEAKALAAELSRQPSSEPERRQMIISLLNHFGLHKELDAMNRQLTEQDNKLTP